jgi:hypothetical protein
MDCMPGVLPIDEADISTPPERMLSPRGVVLPTRSLVAKPLLAAVHQAMDLEELDAGVRRRFKRIHDYSISGLRMRG